MTARLAIVALVAASLAAQVPDSVAGHLMRGVAAREAGRLPEAERELRAAVQAAPRLAEAHLYLGLVLHESSDFAGAAESLGTALELKPTLPGAHELLGYDLLLLGRAEEAIPHLDAALRENSANSGVQGWLGRALLEAGRSREAVPHLVGALASAPSDPELLYLLGKAYSRLASEAQARLLAGSPASVFADLAIAEDHDLNGRAEEALEAYRKALAKDGSLHDAWRAVGDLERDLGRHRPAADAYLRALETGVGDAALRLRCGEALLALGLASEALPHLEAAARAAPPQAEALAALGKALLDLERLPEARGFLLRALGGSSDDVRMRVHYQLSQAERRLGDAAAAQEHLREFAALRARLTSGDR